MDSLDFAQNFLTAFDVNVMSWNVSMNSGPMTALYMGYETYTINIHCRTKTPLTNQMEHFAIGSPEHILVEVKTSSNLDNMGAIVHGMELTYKSTNLDKFVCDLRNKAYNRYSDKFHKQLDNILD